MKDITIEERNKLADILSFNMMIGNNDDELTENIVKRLKETPVFSALMIRLGVDIFDNIPEMNIQSTLAHVIYLVLTLDDIRSEENAIQSNDT